MAHRSRVIVRWCLIVALLLTSMSCNQTNGMESDGTPGAKTSEPPGDIAVAHTSILEDLGLPRGDIELLTSPPPPEVEGIAYSAFPDGVEPGQRGTAYHVHADQGRDTASGTRENPFATMDKALAVAQDGDQVVVHAGTYRTSGLTVTQSDFLLTAYGDGEVRITPISGEGAIGLSIDSPGQHDVMVRGLLLDGFADLGIHLGHPDTVRNVVLESLTVRRSAEGVAGWHDSDDPIIDGLWVKRLSLLEISSIGFTFGQGPGNNVRITGLYVRGTGLHSGDTAEDALAFEHGKNVLVENSVVEHVGGDGIDLKAERVAVINSVVRHVGRNGIKLWRDGYLQGCLVFDTGADAQLVTEAGRYRITECIFADHLRDGGRSYTATFAYDSPGQELHVDIRSCIFYRQPGPIFFPDGADVHIGETIFWGFPDSYIELGEERVFAEDLDLMGRGNRVEEPAFSDPDSGDFRIH